MTVTQNDNYKAELHRALEKCQFVEEQLKMCLLSAIDIARIQGRPFFPLKLKPEDISDLPLGRLAKAFAKIHDDKTLHHDLESLRKKRNDVAHRSLLFTMGELADEAHMQEQTDKMEAVADYAAEVHARVLDVRCALVKDLNRAKRTEKRDDE